MKVYVFGNEDLTLDNKPFDVAKHFAYLNEVEFIQVGLNKDLPFENKENVVLIDTIQGLDEITLINNEDLNKLETTKSSSVHDYDLGFQLKYLQKLGKLGKVTIIGIPMEGYLTEKDYLRIQLIFKKLVAQDMQGS